jgi:hypothetical protein
MKIDRNMDDDHRAFVPWSEGSVSDKLFTIAVILIVSCAVSWILCQYVDTMY